MSKQMAKEIIRDIASWLVIYLLHRGWKKPSVHALIKASFTPEAADSPSRDGYCKRTFRVISGATIKSMEAHKALYMAGVIDCSLGFTASELKEIRGK